MLFYVLNSGSHTKLQGLKGVWASNTFPPGKVNENEKDSGLQSSITLLSIFVKAPGNERLSGHLNPL